MDSHHLPLSPILGARRELPICPFILSQIPGGVNLPDILRGVSRGNRRLRTEPIQLERETM